MTTEHPKTDEGYKELIETRGFIVDIPGHAVWYGVDTMEEAINFTTAEQIMMGPESPVNR